MTVPSLAISYLCVLIQLSLLTFGLVSREGILYFLFLHG